MRGYRVSLLLVLLIASSFVASIPDDALRQAEPFHQAEDSEDLPKSKFSDRVERKLLRTNGVDEARRKIRDELFGIDMVTNNNGTCDHGVHLLWTTQLGSSIVATPRIVDLHSDGRKEILVPTYTQYVEALDGITGEDVAGFPFAHPHFRSHSSPLPVDLNGDGILEWLIATSTGELMFLEENGRVAKTIKIPPLPVKKDWRKKPGGNHSTSEKTLAPNVMNLRLQQLLNQARAGQRTLPGQMSRPPQPMPQAVSPDQLAAAQDPKAPMPTNGGARRMAGRTLMQQQQQEAPTDIDHDIDGGDDAGDDGSGDGSLEHDYDRHDYDEYLRDMYGEDPYQDDDASGDDSEALAPATIGVDGWLSAEARASMDLVFHPELYESSVNVEPENDPFHFSNMESAASVVVSSDEIAVDAHVLSTPVVVDMDGDGTLDAVLHVSYYFDTEYYSRLENQGVLPDDLNTEDYFANALVCMDLITGKVKWLKLLHLASRDLPQVPIGLSTPVVININGDLLFDVFVTTPLGFIFGFDGRGMPLPGWPVHMAPLLSGCVAEDLNGDGKVDICAGDIRGSVACFNAEGREIWEKQIAGAVTDTPTVGDVNGDGVLDLVVCTSAGGIYALDGRHGGVLNNFPVMSYGPILASPLLVNLNNTNPPALAGGERGLHIVVPSHDGYLYIVSGSTGCFELIDLGEKSSSMVLADDMTGNGFLDLVVTTMSGAVMVYSTETPFHPLKAWTSRTKALNGATASEGHVGIYIHESSRTPRDIRGDRFKLLVTISDQRPLMHRTASPRYIVTVLIGTRIVVFSGMFFEAKTIPLELHAPLERLYGIVRVVLSLPNGQHYEDTAAMSFNMHFLETIKFLLIGPFIIAMIALSFVTKEHTIKMTQYMVYQSRRRVYYDDDDF